MRHLAATFLLAFAASAALAQANGNFAPGGIADGSEASVDAAESMAPDGQSMPEGRQGEGRQSATQGSKMMKQGSTGAQSPRGAEAPNKP